MSLAKNFEHNIAEQLKNIGVFVYRLSDLVNKFGVSNPCDYFAYKHPNMYLLEMKTTAGSSLPLKNISDFQYNSMLESSKIKGMKPYFIIWYYDRDVTIAVPIEVIKDIKETNKKSIRYDYNDKRIIKISGEKKKIYFEYDWSEFFGTMAHICKRTRSKTRKCKGNKRSRYYKCTFRCG